MMGGGQAGGPMSNLPTTLPYTSAISVPGAPFWGPGSTFIQPNAGQGGQQMPEIIGLETPGACERELDAKRNARRLPGTPPPAPANAPPNSIPDSARPHLAPGALEPLRLQMRNQLNALRPGKALGANVIGGDISNFFSNLPQSVENQMPGGYVPGFQVPQNSIQYVPSSATAGLEQALLANPLKRQTNLQDIFSKWQTGLSGLDPVSGFNVPTIGPSGAPTGTTAKK
jgi:hypothetical protein